MAKTARKVVDLALQGGGVHGAYTWGVLHRLLEDERIEILGISGTSAGAMNAVVMADGILKGGRSAAISALDAFWREIGDLSGQYLRAPGPAAFFLGEWAAASHAVLYSFYDMISRYTSPYDFNPLNLNPVTDILRKLVDFDALRAAEEPRLFVTATNVRTGRLKLFRNADLTADAVMASACLPTLFQAVELDDGEAYWDGGYVGNPALLPLIAESRPRDLILVQINPSERRDVPKSPRAIMDRLNEITFNTSLVKEMRAVTVLKQLLEAENLPPGHFQQALFEQVNRLLVHRIHALEELSAFDVASKFIPSQDLLIKLHDIGYRESDAWLAENFSALGRRSTVDLAKNFL